MKRLFISLTLILISLTSMAKEIKTEIVIQATPQKIWEILTDFESYPNWNPFITSISGNIQTGNRITVNINPPNGSSMTFKPKVLTIIENKELSWIGSVLFKGLFDGQHKFTLTDNENGTTTFIQSEEFKGIFVWLFNPQKTKNGFNTMNQKLKELAEKQ